MTEQELLQIQQWQAEKDARDYEGSLIEEYPEGMTPGEMDTAPQAPIDAGSMYGQAMGGVSQFPAQQAPAQQPVNSAQAARIAYMQAMQRSQDNRPVNSVEQTEKLPLVAAFKAQLEGNKEPQSNGLAEQMMSQYQEGGMARPTEMKYEQIVGQQQPVDIGSPNAERAYAEAMMQGRR